jgi:hypothetical protein
MWRPGAKGGLLYSGAQIRAEEIATRTMKHIVNRFNNCVHQPDDWPWTDIFQQPITDRTPGISTAPER